MFDFIRGFVRKTEPEYCVLDVGGVGFRIYTSLSSIGAVAIGEEVTFYTHLVVKEDDMSLFGFITEDELNAFELLISVSGVGPKVAVAILAQMTAAEFCTAVISGNHKALSKAKGVGAKLAQRVVLELKDKVKKSFDVDGETSGALDSLGQDILGALSDNGGTFNEAVEALMVLGYNTQRARQAVGKVYQDGMALEELVKAALKG